MGTITQTARFRLVKPVDGDWNRLGSLLRALRTPLHRVLNGIVTELELDARRQHHGLLVAHPRTASYRLARDLWAAERQAAQTRCDEKRPYVGDAAMAGSPPSSSAILGVSGVAYARWHKWRQDAWRGASSLPSFRARGPVYVSSHGVSCTARDGDIVLGVRLLAKGHATEELIILPHGANGFVAARKILAGAKLGDVRLICDDRDGSWQVLVAYTHEVCDAEPGATMALHRGISTFLTAAVGRTGAREAYTTIIEGGADILAHKAAYTARRKSLGRHARSLGAGAKGHGDARRHEHITRLEDSDDRWVRSKCQEVAAHVMRLATRKHVSRLLIEDWSTPGGKGLPEQIQYLIHAWPFARLREMIAWAGKRAGITVEYAATSGNGRTCPMCSHVEEAWQRGTFRCSKCMLERPADVVFAWNMLLRDGQPNPAPDAKARAKRQRGMRKKLLSEQRGQDQ